MFGDVQQVLPKECLGLHNQKQFFLIVMETANDRKFQMMKKTNLDII